MVRFGVPGQNSSPLAYADERLASVPAVQGPRRPTVNDKKYPIWTEWRVNKNAVAPVLEGEFWKLVRFESNGDATWVMINAAQGGTLDDIRDQVNVQVTPSASGDIDIDGVTVANAANPSGIPLETVADTATNTLKVNVQVGAAVTGAPGDKNDAGIVSFDDTAFAVDGDGYVTLTGGPGPAVDSFAVPNGTSPVVPDAAGLITITESSGVTITGGVNTYDVALDGAVVGQTITGDDTTPLSPTAGNWNIYGLSGSKTSGSGSTLTIKSPPFSQVGGSATSTLNTGEFVTAAVTRTLPASAGLIDGDLFIFVCTTANALVIQSVTAQQIRIGSLISSAAGTATSTAIGDSVTLRFNAIDGFLYAVSSIGTWVLA